MERQGMQGLNKFEKLYEDWKYRFEKHKELVSNFQSSREQVIKDTEHLDEMEVAMHLFDVESMTHKSSHDLNIQSLKLKTAFDMLEDKSNLKDSAIRDIEGIELVKTYYAYIDGELKEVNPEMHEATRENYKQMLHTMKVEN